LAISESELQAKILRMLDPEDEESLEEEEEETLDRSFSKKLARSDTVTTEALFTSLRSNLSTYSSSQSEVRLRQIALEEDEDEENERLDTVPSLSLALQRARSNKRRITQLSMAMTSIDSLLLECQDFVEDLLDEENGIKKSYARSPSFAQSTSMLPSSYSPDTKEIGRLSNGFKSMDNMIPSSWRNRSSSLVEEGDSSGSLISRLQKVVTSHLTSPILPPGDLIPVGDTEDQKIVAENVDYYDLDDILAADDNATGSPVSMRSTTASSSLAETGEGSTLFSASRQNSFSSLHSADSSAGQSNKNIPSTPESPSTPPLRERERERTLSDKTLPEIPNRSSTDTVAYEPVVLDGIVGLQNASPVQEVLNTEKTSDAIQPVPLALQETLISTQNIQEDNISLDDEYVVAPDDTFRDMDPSRLSIMDDTVRSFVFKVSKDDQPVSTSIEDQATDRNTKTNAEPMPPAMVRVPSVTPPPRKDSVNAVIEVPAATIPASRTPSMASSVSVRKTLIREVSNEDLRLVTVTSDTSSVKSQVPELAQVSPVISDSTSDHSNESSQSVKKNVSFVEDVAVSPDRKLNRAAAIVPGFILKWKKKTRSSPTRKVKASKSILKTPEPPRLSFEAEERSGSPDVTFVEVPSSKLSLGSDFGVPPRSESSANPSLTTITDESVENMDRSVSVASESTAVQKSFEEPVANLSVPIKEGSMTLNRNRKKTSWLSFPSLSLGSEKKEKETKRRSNELHIKSMFGSLKANLKRRPSLTHKTFVKDRSSVLKRNSEDISRRKEQEWGDQEEDNSSENSFLGPPVTISEEKLNA
jgi:hypothetical protein